MGSMPVSNTICKLLINWELVIPVIFLYFRHSPVAKHVLLIAPPESLVLLIDQVTHNPRFSGI